MMRTLAIFLYCLYFTFGLSQNELVIWQPTNATTPGGAGNFGPNQFFPTFTHPNITVTPLVRGSGVLIPTGASGAALAWGGTDFLESGWSSASAAGDYYEFTIKANPGYLLTLDGIGAHNVRRSATGPTHGQWMMMNPNISIYWIIVGAPTILGTNTTSSGNEIAPVDISWSSNHANLPDSVVVTFRFVAYGATATGGTLYLINGNNAATTRTFSITGSVVPNSVASIVETGELSKKIVKNTDIKNEIAFGLDAKDVHIYNMTGQLVKTTTVRKGDVIDVSEWQPGTYIIKGLVDKQPVTTKVVKH